MGYDVTLAVQAYRVLEIEAHTFEECKQLVWDPTQKILDELAKQRPKSLTFLRERPRQAQSQEGVSCGINIVGAGKKVAYIGKIVDRKKAFSIFEWFLETFKKFPDKTERLRQLSDPMTIIRWWIMCSIPVESDGINQQSAEKGIKKYLTLFAPGLAHIPISWLPEKKQAAVQAFISSQANRLADPQLSSREERLRIFSGDI